MAHLMHTRFWCRFSNTKSFFGRIVQSISKAGCFFFSCAIQNFCIWICMELSDSSGNLRISKTHRHLSASPQRRLGPIASIGLSLRGPVIVEWRDRLQPALERRVGFACYAAYVLRSSYRSRQSELARLISSVFHRRFHAFIAFSRRMASAMSLKTS